MIALLKKIGNCLAELGFFGEDELYYIGGVACGDIVVHDIYPYVNNKRPKLSKIHRKLDGFFIYKSIIY